MAIALGAQAEGPRYAVTDLRALGGLCSYAYGINNAADSLRRRRNREPGRPPFWNGGPLVSRHSATQSGHIGRSGVSCV